MEHIGLSERRYIVDSVVSTIINQKKEVIKHSTQRNHKYNCLLNDNDFLSFCIWFITGTSYSSNDFREDNKDMLDIIKDSMIYYLENVDKDDRYDLKIFYDGTWLPFYNAQKYLYNLFIKFEIREDLANGL